MTYTVTKEFGKMWKSPVNNHVWYDKKWRAVVDSPRLVIQKIISVVR